MVCYGGKLARVNSAVRKTQTVGKYREERNIFCILSEQKQYFFIAGVNDSGECVPLILSRPIVVIVFKDFYLFSFYFH